jgi:hypothetical protein
MNEAALTPVEDVAALPPSSTMEVASSDLLHLEGSAPFEAAGWRFVRSEPDLPGLRAVFRDPDGRLSIEGATVAVRFRDDLADDAIEKILQNHHLKVQRSVSFLPNAYELSFQDKPHRGQLLRVSRLLDSLDCVTYADPDVVELFGPRER